MHVVVKNSAECIICCVFLLNKSHHPDFGLIQVSKSWKGGFPLDQSHTRRKLCFLSALSIVEHKKSIHLIFSIYFPIILAPFLKRFLCLLASQSTGHSLSLFGEGVTQKRSNKLAIIQQWVSPRAFIIQMSGLFRFCSGRPLIHPKRVREIIASVRWTFKRGRPLFSSDPASQDHSLIPHPWLVVHIQALFSPAAHLPKPPTPPLTRYFYIVFLPLIPPGMWLWLWRGCPVCALPEQPLQRGPEPAEVQALPGLWTHQPLPEGQLLHHQQCRVWRLSARVRGQTPDSCVIYNKHLLFSQE